MQTKIKLKTRKLIQSPAAKKALTSLKPERSLWGFAGVILFFIVPEIIAFIWGDDITRFAKEELIVATSGIKHYYYELLVMLFEEGGSPINLLLGIVLLVWLFF
ncbi:MAG TPA: hypothetical protein CFH81_01985 [Sulfurovum sp. UBA12169]|nr:MAG TPA: hypothetical protein CFH81_01985 [Sulfurovum sp. UBA12169]